MPPPPPTWDVFLAYAGPDKPAAEALYRALQPQCRPFWDGALDPGDLWVRRLPEALGRSRIVAVLVSGNTPKSWYQSAEYVAAIDRARSGEGSACRVVPVQLTTDAELPFGINPLVPLDASVEGGMERVAQELARLAGEMREPSDDPDGGEGELHQSSGRLDALFEARAELKAEGDDTADLDAEIVALKRAMREGPELEPGEFLAEGRFKLLEAVGRGGFATVWKALCRERGELVAVKVLHGQWTRDETRRGRFFRGARHMARLDHPHVVRVVLERGKDSGFQYFAMEYLPGGDLRRAVLEGRLAGEEALRAVLKAGTGLQAAHYQGLIHRDVKPHNILLAADGTPKLTDFDLVRAADTTGGTRTGALGAFLYAAPEMMQDASRADLRADVYGLGMTAVFVLAGRELPYDVVRESDGFIEGLDCGETLKDALRKAVAWRAEERFGSVGEMITTVMAASLPPSMFVPADVERADGRIVGEGPGGAQADAPPRESGRATDRSIGPTEYENGQKEPPGPAAHQEEVDEHGKAPSPPSADSLGFFQPEEPPFLGELPDVDAVTVREWKRPDPGSEVDPGQGESSRGSQWSRPLLALGRTATTLRCPYCGAVLDGDPSEGQAAICQFCDSTFIPRRKGISRSIWSLVLGIPALLVVAALAAMVAEFVWAEVRRAGEPGEPADDPVGLTPETAVPATTSQEQPIVGKGDHRPLRWILVPGGTFIMGSEAGEDDEKPVHEVTLEPFEMTETEVTVGQWGECVASGHCAWPDLSTNTFPEGCNTDVQGPKSSREDHPMNCVSWDEAGAFALWTQGQLPTEAQWEYAARSQGKRHRYPWGNEPATCDRALVDSEEEDCGYRGTRPVCSKPAGNTGQQLCDIAGNVWEWTADRYGVYPADAVTDPRGPSRGFGRVVRGGYWGSGPMAARTTDRFWVDPSNRGHDIGFRLTRPVPP